jgi:hypothetical protein
MKRSLTSCPARSTDLALVRILVAGFLKMLFQLLFRVAAALANSAHLLGGGCRVCVQVRPMLRKVLAHS